MQEESIEKITEKRKDKIKAWLKNPHNALLVAVLIFAFIIRIYFFVITQNQPLWWDEAEYMLKAKNIALGTPETGWSADVRPILFPFLSSVFFMTNLGEIPIRFIMVFISVIGIFFIYLIGKNIFNEKVGLIAAFLMSIFYIDIFYTTRLLVDVPQNFFILAAAALFVQYFFKEGKKQLVWFILPLIILGTQMRFTVALFAFILLVFLLLVQGFSLFKKKEWYISGLLAVALLIPYGIYTWIKFNKPFYTILVGLSSSGSARGEGVTATDIFMQYVNYFPSYTHLIIFFAFILGLVLILINAGLAIDKIRSNKNIQKNVLVLLWTIIPIIYFGFFVNHFEDRYIFMAFPAIFIIGACAFDFIYIKIKTHAKILSLFILFGLLLYAAYADLSRSNLLIQSKLHSYEGLKDAGLWIKSNSAPNISIISAGVPEVTYYSERPAYSYPQKEEDLDSLIKEKGAEYLILSIWEPSPQWSYNWPQNHQDRVEVVQAYFIEGNNQQPSAIIYRIK